MDTRQNRLAEAVLTSTHNLCFERKYEKYQSFLSENFQFLEVKFSIYLNRRVFVMSGTLFLLALVIWYLGTQGKTLLSFCASKCSTGLRSIQPVFREFFKQRTSRLTERNDLLPCQASENIMKGNIYSSYFPIYLKLLKGIQNNKRN